MLGNGQDRHQREMRDLLKEHGRLVRSQGGREVWQFANGKTVVVPGQDARVKDPHSWKNALGAVRRAIRDVGTANPRKPTVFQNLLRSAREMPNVLQSLTGAHVIVADEVARLYASDPDRAWHMEDFPNVMPPFGRYFVEWDIVAPTGQRVTGGILFTSQSLDTPTKVSAVKEVERGLVGQDLLGCTLVEADLFIDVSGHVTYLGSVVYFADVDGQTKRLSADGGLIVKPDERALRELGPAMNRAGESDAFTRIVERRPNATPFVSLMISLLNVGVLATCFLHSRSTRLSPAETKQSEVRRRLLKPGQQQPPVVRYHVLEIEPMKKVLRTEGRQAEEGLKKALHTVRGHFKLFADKGMFGRDDLRGLFWFESHSRGDPDRGTVVKDYSIGPIKPGDGPTGNPDHYDADRQAWARLDGTPEGTAIEVLRPDGIVQRAEFMRLHELPGLVWVRFLDMFEEDSGRPVEATIGAAMIRLVSENPTRTCPGCGKGIKDAAARCWSCGLVFQGDESMRPMFDRVARAGVGRAANPERKSIDTEIRELMRQVEDNPENEIAAQRLDVLLRRVGGDVAERFREEIERRRGRRS